MKSLAITCTYLMNEKDKAGMDGSERQHVKGVTSSFTATAAAAASTSTAWYGNHKQLSVLRLPEQCCTGLSC